MASRGSFAQRMASLASTVENWDDDGDFQGDGDLFNHSMSTVQSLSSRVSVRSESNTGDDDWQVLIAPNDDLSKHNAIASAKQAGIPIPTSVPPSALLGGQINRLGKKKSNRKVAVDDDWGEDLELPTNPTEGLKLKAPQPKTPADDQDEFDDWGEGSLGIRFAGTKRDGRGGRSSSISAMSPSMGSIITLESEDDDLMGLVLPNEPLDFTARLEKLKKAEQPTPDISPLPTQQKRELPPTSAPVSSPPGVPVLSPPIDLEPALAPRAAPPAKPAEDEEDFLDGLEFGGTEMLDTQKLTLNRNVVVKKPAKKPAAPPAARPATTLTFTDKQSSSSRIPRPLTTSASRTRLTPLYESGASTIGHNRPMPTTTSAQLLRAKRSAPALRNNLGAIPRPPVPFLPAGNSTAQSHHVSARSSQSHLRRDSDPYRPQSPSSRPFSRLSTVNPPDTPGRSIPSRQGSRRENIAPATLAREAVNKRFQARPLKNKTTYGDGSELDVFDDLPTSATKEKKFEKAPVLRSQLSNKTIKAKQSNSRLPQLDRTTTPVPQTPRSPTKVDSTPRFARDTTASRIAREQRLAGTRPRSEGPMAPTMTNWKAQIAARSPHTSPSTHRKKGSGQKPTLIKALGQPFAKNEKGMTFNPVLQRWEGNEDALAPFSHQNTSTTTLALTTASTPTFAPPHNPFHVHDRSHSISHTALSAVQAAHQLQPRPSSSRLANAAQPSPPRAPALISHMSTARGVQIEGKMIFDPAKMCWLKLGRTSGGDPRSPSVEGDDEEDPFAGLEDLKDNDNTASGGASGLLGATSGGDSAFEEQPFVGEEFDLGPSFIKRQRDEEMNWRAKVSGWVGPMRDTGESRGGWRWAVRQLAASATAEASRDYH